MVTLNTIRRISIDAQTTGVDRAKSDLQGLAQAADRAGKSVDNLAIVTETSARRQLSAAGAYDRVRTSVDSAYRAQLQYERGVRAVERAAAQNVGTEAERARTLQLLKDRYERATGAQDAHARSTGLAAHQVANLRSQIFDVGQSLYGGMNPLMILAQQGPQVLEALGPGRGLTGILRGVGTALADMVPLSTGVFGGVAAGVGTVAAAYARFDSAQKAVAIGLTGLGRQSGLAAGQINDIARASDLATGTARDFATAFAATGNATADTIATALSKTRDFATTLNLSYDEAAKVQTEFFTDAGSAYDKYSARLGAYSAGTSRFVRDLQMQGRGGEAVRAAFDAINPALARYNELASIGQKTTDLFSTSWGNFWSNVSRGAGVLTGDSRLTTTPQQIAAAASAGAMARQQAAAERANAVIIEQARANRLLNVDPVRREVLQAQERAGVSNQGPTIEERFSNAFSTAANASVGSFGQYPTTYGNAEERMRKAMTPTPEESRAAVERVTQQANDISQARSLDDTLKQATRSQQAQAAAIGKTTGEAERLTARASLLNAATRDGIPLSDENRRKIDEVAASYGRYAQSLAETALKREVLFQREQLGRNPGDAAIAAQLRGIYGDDTGSPGAKVIAEQLRLNANIRDTQALYSSLAQMGSGLIDPLVDSTRSWSDAFSDLSRQIARAALQAALFGQGPFAAIMGTQGAGVGPGGAFGALISRFSGGFGSLFGGGYGASQYQAAAAAAAPGMYGPGFADGGYTGHGGRLEPAGIVHRGEYVFDAASTARIGIATLEAMRGRLRGYADGGPVMPVPSPMLPALPSPAAAGPSNVEVNVMNAPADYTATATVTQTANGPRVDIQLEKMLGQMVADGRLDRALKQRFGMRAAG